MDWTQIAGLWTIIGLVVVFLTCETFFRHRRGTARGRPARLPRAEYSPERAERLLYMTLYLQRCIDHGLRVRFLRPVGRLPFFKVAKGATGEILHPLSDPTDDRLTLRVKLDDPPDGAQEFGGEVHWKEDYNLESFEKDVELYRPVG